MSPLLLVLPGNEAFADALARCGMTERSNIAWHRFPDGESLVRVDADCAGRDVAILATQHDPDHVALPVRFAAATARELGARRVGLIAPYLGYLRQDKRFHPGECVSSVHFARFLDESFDWLVTVDPHLHRHAALAAIFRMRTRAVSSAPGLADWIAANVRAPVVVGPDAESAQWVEQVAARIAAPSTVLAKTRRGDREVEVTLPDPRAIAGRTPVLVDDIVSSARTLAAATEHLVRLGAAPVCIAVHALFAGDAASALAQAGAASVVTANTVPHFTNAIDVAPAVAAAVREITSPD